MSARRTQTLARCETRAARTLLAAALLVAALFLMVSRAHAQVVSVTVNAAPPELPVYDQPPLPAPGYLWVPGYWSYGPEGYFWVPGTWVEPPAPALVWTPGYWGWSDGTYVWNEGYWGPVIGFYGGINYGYGYPGHGYYGGEWRGDQFFYNRAAVNVTNVNVTNVYNRTVVNNVTVNTVSYNGGPGGVSAQPTSEEQAAAHQPHRGPTAQQTQHVAGARSNRELLASANHGHPPIAATPKPAAFSGAGVVRARGAPSAAAAEHAAPQPAPASARHEPATPPPAPASAPHEPAAPAAARDAPHGNPAPEGRSAATRAQAPIHLAQKPEGAHPPEAPPPAHAAAHAAPPPHAPPHEAKRPEERRPDNGR
jgi:hypothetical protein